MYERILKKVETAVKTVKDSQENSEDAQAQAREVPVAHNPHPSLHSSDLKSINVSPTMCTLILRPFVTAHKRSLGQGNFLHLSVSHSVHSGYRSGRYASCRNAYLFNKRILIVVYQ